MAEAGRVVGVFGMGLLGGSVALGLRERMVARRPRLRRRPHRARGSALALGAADVVHAQLGPWVGELDLGILATSSADARGHGARDRAPYARPGSLWMDVGSVKASVVAALEPLLPRASSAPTTWPGARAPGVQDAYAGLLQSAAWCLTPTPRTDADALTEVEALVRELGAYPFELDADVLTTWWRASRTCPGSWPSAWSGSSVSTPSATGSCFPGHRRLPRPDARGLGVAWSGATCCARTAPRWSAPRSPIYECLSTSRRASTTPTRCSRPLPSIGVRATRCRSCGARSCRASTMWWWPSRSTDGAGPAHHGARRAGINIRDIGILKVRDTGNGHPRRRRQRRGQTRARALAAAGYRGR
ncbi:MAG: prephenate dehydrogenase/arogenate dehydrogenase family protein [Myxococcota bacterium]